MTLIPKKLHIIWLGSDVRMEHRTRVEAWRKINPDYAVYLWIDDVLLAAKEGDEDGNQLKHSTEETARFTQLAMQGQAIKVDADEYLKSQKGTFRKYYDISSPFLSSTARKSIRNWAKPLGVHVRSTRSLYDTSVNGDLIWQESFARGANYGAASDMFRLEVLYAKGGIYVDTDIEPVKPLGDLDAKHDFLIAQLPQKKGPPAGCNCILASTVANRFVDNYRRTTRKTYCDNLGNLKGILQFHSKSREVIRGRVINWSGPTQMSTGLYGGTNPISFTWDEKDFAFPLDRVIVKFENTWLD